MTGPRLRSRLLIGLTGGLLLTGVSGLFSGAYWSVDPASVGAGRSALTSVEQGKQPTISASAGSLTVSWAASTLTNGAAVSGYTVQRYDDAGVLQSITGGCAGTRTTLSCNETGVPDGSWRYAVTPLAGTSWTGPQSPRSTAVVVDGTAPTNTITENGVSSHLRGTTLYYKGNATSSRTFTLTSTVSDPGGSGQASAATASLAGTPTGFTHNGSTVSSPSGGPYTSGTFTWANPTTSTPTETITARDVAGNTSQTTLSFVNDITAPTGGTISSGAAALKPTGSVVAVTAGGTLVETGSGTATTVIHEGIAPLVNHTTCGTYTYTQIGTEPGTYDRTLIANNTCYRHRYLVTDNVGNTTQVNSNVTRVRDYANTVATTTGAANHYWLGDTSTTTAVDTISAGGTDNLTWTGGVSVGAAGAITNDTNTAVTFDGVNDCGTAAWDHTGDFSVELWFKSTQGLGTSNNWYDGAGLVDADASGVSKDWGVALMANGRVAAGTGSPDTTILSGPGFNDGAWHHVVFTRQSSSGMLVLYVDGVQRASGTGVNGALTANRIAVGCQQPIGTLVHFLAGSLDEVAGYNAVMSLTDVRGHYGLNDHTAPTNTVGANGVNAATSGSRIYYRGSSAGALTLTNAVADVGSGPQSASTGALSGTQAGWSHTPTNVALPAGGPFVSSPFTWSAGTTSSPSTTVVAFDNAGNQSSQTLTFVDDSTAPVGGALNHPTGLQPDESFTISMGSASDLGSGVTSRVLEYASAAYTAGACAAYGGWTVLATDPGATLSVNPANGRCYRFRYVLTDAVGNQRTVEGPGEIIVRRYAGQVATTGGVLSLWSLGEPSGTAILDAVGTNTGTWSGGPTLGTTGAITGNVDTAVTFDGVNDCGEVNRTIEDDFSIEFWFQSTQGLGTGGQWYTGAGLIDADVSGAANDFGISLSADGRVLAGVGNPDTTISSNAGFNNGAWHHVVLTRTRSTGRIGLFVDGTERSSGTGTTASLRSPARLTFGCGQTNVKYFAGSLDEVALYSTALSASQVQTHYNAR